jgi:hypothetical protein
MNTPGDRTIFVFNSGQVESVRRLTDAIANKLVTSLFNCNDRLHWLDEARKLTPVSTRLLSDLLDRFFISVLLTTRDDGSHVVEYHPLTLGQQDLIDVVTALVHRVAKGPSRPKTLSDQQKGHIRDRLNQGEPKEMIAEAYSIDIATVQAIRAAATG